MQHLVVGRKGVFDFFVGLDAEEELLFVDFGQDPTHRQETVAKAYPATYY